MAEVLLFHHAQGLTPGVTAFADELRRAGHLVHTPDLYDGHTFDTLDAGIGFAERTGFGTILERGVAAADNLPEALVYAGFSLGAMPAQKLAQTRPGAGGALLVHSCIPVSEFATVRSEPASGAIDNAWPTGIPVQVHGMDGDPLFTEDGGDLDAARALVAASDDAELFLYPGKEHLFADSSLPSYDRAAADLLTSRTLEFLGPIH